MKFLALPILLAFAITSTEAPKKPLTLEEALAEVTQKAEPEPKPEPVELAEVVEEEPKPVEKMWKCTNCGENENRTLEFLQERGIKDRAALATVMGNIQQESMFITNICEGGARVPYEQCHSGGFGLIQWTTVGR